MKSVNLQGLCSMPSPASEIPGTSVQEATKIVLKGTAYCYSVLHSHIPIQDNLSVQEDGLSLPGLLTV